MPEISRFYGIVIGMFYHEHRPPHFHARYGEHEAVIRINDLVLTEGHRAELLENWEAIENQRPLSKIEPLD
jgi:hypothetical protein